MGSWFPNGKDILHVRWVPEEDGIEGKGFELFITDTTDNNARRLTYDYLSQYYPKVSSNGEMIAYTEEHPFNHKWNIAVMRLSSKEVFWVTEAGGEYPAWSPDNEHLVFVNEWIDGGLYIVNINTESAETLAKFNY